MTFFRQLKKANKQALVFQVLSGFVCWNIRIFFFFQYFLANRVGTDVYFSSVFILRKMHQNQVETFIPQQRWYSRGKNVSIPKGMCLIFDTLNHRREVYSLRDKKTGVRVTGAYHLW